MTLETPRQAPILLQTRRKSDVRTQFAALCFRIRMDKTEILLITTRGTGRWSIPKGWPQDGLTPSECALAEAWEEAGVKGRAFETSLGLYSYHKTVGPDRATPCVAIVYPVRVKSLAGKFPEAGQRKRKWLSVKKAAARVGDPELAHILKGFDPRRLKG